MRRRRPACQRLPAQICARNTGIGADGWMLVSRRDLGLETRLFNSDGSEPELSGNGTRCAAAFALLTGAVNTNTIQIRTVAGDKQLQLISRQGNRFEFRMNMGLPILEDRHRTMRLAGADYDATILNVGNPQCAIFVDSFPNDWRAAAREAEAHSLFPHRSNVSFVRVLDRHTIEALFLRTRRRRDPELGYRFYGCRYRCYSQGCGPKSHRDTYARWVHDPGLGRERVFDGSGRSNR